MIISNMEQDEPHDYADYKQTVIYEASATDVGVYELWWDANSRHPDWPLSERLALAERLIHDLIATEQLHFFRAGWTGPGDREPIEATQLADVLRRARWCCRPRDAWDC